MGLEIFNESVDIVGNRANAKNEGIDKLNVPNAECDRGNN